MMDLFQPVPLRPTMRFAEPVTDERSTHFIERCPLDCDLKYGFKCCKGMQTNSGMLEVFYSLGEVIADDRQTVVDDCTLGTQSLDSRQTAASGSDQVFYQDNLLAGDVAALDALFCAVSFGFLPDEDGGLLG